MSRLQKKCLVSSAVVHAVLFLLLIVGSAFVPSIDRPEDRSVELVMIPDILVNEEMVGGGGTPEAAAPVQQPAPVVTPPAPAPVVTPPMQAPVQPPTPAPRQPDPEPVVEEKPAPKPVQVNPDALKPKQVKPETVSDAIAPEAPAKPKKPAIQINLDNKVTRTVKSSPSTAAADAAAQAEQKAQAAAQAAAQQRSAQVANAIGSISTKASTGTTIGIPGPGGQAYAGYGIYLRDLYEKAWNPPSAARDNEPVVEVEVVIARDGRVVSAKITKKSGNVSLDNSVQTTLNRVRQARPLPEGTTDTQRTFKINFNLTTKLGSG